MQLYNMTIDGVADKSTQYVDVINPATGEAFAQCQNGNVDTLNSAVSAARKAFSTWGRTSSDERRAKMHELANVLETNMPELMELITKETGKPMGGLNNVGSGMEVGGAIAWTQYTAELELAVDIAQDDADARIEVHRKPLGVVGSITPWNWPLMIAIWHVIPALRAGNTVVIKPSELTPLATMRFIELANEVLPAGVLNVVTGDGSVGAALTSHSDVNKIIFTGSTPTGKHIMASAAGNLKRLTLELGGNDAGIVLPDVDVKSTAAQLFGACFHNNGQTCAALKRLYVHEDIYEEICAEMAEHAKKVTVGNGLEEGVELGPIQNEKQLQIVMELAADAKANGGRFVAGGNRIEGPGYFFEPTLVADLKDGSRLVDEEPFGPIVPIIKYSDINDVITTSNQNDCGLGGSIWSADIEKATELAKSMECGSVWINTHGAVQPNMPFGGIKQSGFGVEFGLYGLEECTSIQALRIPK
ncbi:aldehyde dehydrogenase family protein [Pseudocolwellia sp. HL-MZ19]|uniref:aldehyde dehydrogenase family protein n=1 Tax=Pseudocolwellia sp. HL-MZ19 TaxID=3400846 RepID=UPI003CEA3EA7